MSQEKSSTFSDSNSRQEHITKKREACRPSVVEHLIVSKGTQIFFVRATCVTDLNNIFLIVVVRCIRKIKKGISITPYGLPAYRSRYFKL